MNKEKVRTAFKSERAKLGFDEWEKLSHTLVEKLLAGSSLTTAHDLAVYVPINHEPNLWPAYREWYSQGKKLFFPLVDGEKLQWKTFDQLPTFTSPQVYELQYGQMHSLVRDFPSVSLDAFQPHVALVPALAVDKQGYRLGYGGGYYDRWLQKVPSSLVTIATVFDFQVVETLPHNEWDVPVQQLITEKGKVF